MTAETSRDGVGVIVRRVVANAGMLLGGRSVNALLGLGYMAIAGRALGAADLGVLVLIHAFAQFLGDVVKFQSWQTVIHYGARPLGEGRATDFQRMLRFTLLLDAGSTLVGVAIGMGGAFLFADRLGFGEAHAPAAALYMLSIIFLVSATPLGLHRLFDRFDVLARVSGSGGTCFALCASDLEAESLAARIAAMAPGWWVRRCRLRGPWT